MGGVGGEDSRTVNASYQVHACGLTGMKVPARHAHSLHCYVLHARTPSYERVYTLVVSLCMGPKRIHSPYHGTGNRYDAGWCQQVNRLASQKRRNVHVK